MEWMTDCDKFQEAIEAEKTYLSSLTHSMSLVLDEFYQTLQGVGVSAVTGDGIDDFFAAVDKAAEEYDTTYKPELERKIAECAAADQERQAAQVEAMKRDVEESAGGDVVLDYVRGSGVQDAELEEEDEEEEEIAADELAKVQALVGEGK